MLDKSEHPVSHEAGRPYRVAAAGDLDDLDDAAPSVDVHPTTIAGRDDVVRAYLATRVNDDLYSVAPHELKNADGTR